jgi:hypothetical protein
MNPKSTPADQPFKNKKEAEAIVGTLSKPSKMPGYAYSTPAKRCLIGQKMRKVAGSICAFCYALKGRYVFPNVMEAMEKRFKSLTHPLWVSAITYLIGKTRTHHFRWHDSGDLQGVWHLKNIVDVAKMLPHISFWLPTREYAFVSSYIEGGGEVPDNLCIRLSALMMDGPAPVGIAQRLGLTVSGASMTGNFNCPSSKQGNKCGDCRKCWDKNVFAIDYKKH